MGRRGLEVGSMAPWKEGPCLLAMTPAKPSKKACGGRVEVRVKADQEEEQTLPDRVGGAGFDSNCKDAFSSCKDGNPQFLGVGIAMQLFHRLVRPSPRAE